MRIVVFGAGSLGTLLGGLLARKHQVTLVGRDPHIAAIQENGLWIAGEIEYHTTPEAATNGASLEATLACVTTKSYDTAEAARTLSTGEFESALSLQNGLGNEERLAAELDCPVLAGTISYGALLQKPGHIECTGLGEVVVGDLNGGESRHANVVGEAFTTAGIETTVVSDMAEQLWEKCATNAAINPLTALVGIENGAVLDDPAWPIASEAARETARTARENGIELTDETALAALRRVAQATEKNTSSMARDVEKGQRTEIDAINGFVVRQANQSVPTNALLVGLIKTWERSNGLR
jgi:2-dehydropantoate 2-reductase